MTCGTVALLALVAFPVTAAAAQSLSLGDSLAGAGDTASAIAAYRALLKHESKNAEAHYRLGMLHWKLATADGKVSADRRAAEEHLRYATRYQPDSAKYWMGLANVFWLSTDASMRVQWGRAARRARELATAHRSPELAEAEYQLGRMKWEEYERHGRRYLSTIGLPRTLPAANDPDAWRDMKNLLETQLRPLPSDQYRGPYLEALEHLTAAANAEPRMVRAAGLLVVALDDEGRWEEALEVTERLVRDAPDSARAWMLHGLALARAGRFREAQAVQERGLGLMGREQRQRYEDLSRVLPRSDSSRWQAAPPDDRSRGGAFYWAVAQPLLLAGTNEVRTEYLARVTYVDFRWTHPFGERDGWVTDRGKVYVRWGPPEIWGTLSENTTLWVYPDLRLYFVFEGSSGFAYARFAGEHQFLYETRANGHPVSFRNVPPAKRVDSAVVQLAQFKGPDGVSTELAVFGFLPVGRMTAGTAATDILLRRAAYVRDGAFRPVAEDLGEERVAPRDTAQFELRSWRFLVRPGEHLVRVEALAPEVDRAARSQLGVAVRGFAGDTLQLSDVLVARRIEPRDSTPESWHQFFIIPSAGRLEPGSPLGLLWESYHLARDSSGVARYRVEVTVTVKELLRGEGIGARVVGGISDALGLSAKGDQRLSLSYERETAVSASGRQVDYLMLDFDRVPNAGYEVEVVVTDLQTGRVARSRREFAVDPLPPGVR